MKPQDYDGNIQKILQAVLDNRGVDSQKTIAYCTQMIQLGENLKDNKLIGFACYYLAENYYLLNDIENYFKYIIQGLEAQQSAGEWEFAAQSYNLLAITSMSQGNAPFSIDYFLTGLNCCRKSNNQELSGIINMNIGALFMQYEEHERALLYIKKSVQIFLDEELTPRTTQNLAAAYTMLANCYLALNLVDEALDNRRKLKGLQISGSVMFSISEKILDIRLSEKENREEQLDANLQELMKLLHFDFPFLDIFDDLFSLCQLLLSIKKYSELLTVLELLENLVSQTQIINLQIRMLTIRIQYYEKINDEKNFLLSAGSYYRLQQRQVKETEYMTGSMLDMRLSMERLAQKQRQVEAENKELLKKSEMDALTGLPNRFKLNDYSEDAFEYSYAAHCGFGIEILDVDFFKEYNDTYGHAAGDHCLRTVGNILKEQATKENVFAARYGGDEFMLIYKNMTKQQIYEVAEQVKDALEAADLVHIRSTTTNRVTISQGIYYGIPDVGNKVWDFLHAADMALYSVKRSTRNGICMDTEKIQALRE